MTITPVSAEAVGTDAGKAPASLRTALGLSGSADVIVEFDAAQVDTEVAQERTRRRLRFDDAALVRMRAQRYRAIKDGALKALRGAEMVVLRNYSVLPLVYARLNSSQALARLESMPGVVKIFPNQRKFPVLDAISANLVGQPSTQGLGLTGQGVTVAVIDTGVNYTQSDFGPCTAPATPSTCKVVYLANTADSSTGLDTSTSGHGTNVAGIIVGVAPGVKIAAINVFGAGQSTTDALIIGAIDWAISNQAMYNIRAINMSLGDGSQNTSPCGSSNPYVTPVNNARYAGILTVAASGNDGYTNAIANPACTPNVVSVGAVYSKNWGQVSAAVCTDAVTGADKVCCFSNSASFLTMLAPGAFISAAGVQLAGTSQAAPFISGAIAIERGGYPSDSLNQTVSRLTSQAVAVTDARNAITKPRLDLYSAVRPSDDDFGNRIALSTSSGSTSGTNAYATKETGEPNHVGNSGGHSVWWKWVAPASGQMSLDTHGSGFDTLLAVYNGTSVSGLTAVAVSDNDGSTNGASGLVFQAQAGVEYEIAVDGANGSSGSFNLTWSLNTSASANLKAALAATPSPALLGSKLIYNLTAFNNGAQSATNVRAILTLPSSVSFSSAATGCTLKGQVVTCQSSLLPSGNSVAWSIVVTPRVIGTIVASEVLTSDVPDPNNGDNLVSLPVSVQIGDASGDVPILPPLAFVLLASVLIWTATRYGLTRPR